MIVGWKSIEWKGVEDMYGMCTVYTVQGKRKQWQSDHSTAYFHFSRALMITTSNGVYYCHETLMILTESRLANIYIFMKLLVSNENHIQWKWHILYALATQAKIFFKSREESLGSKHLHFSVCHSSNWTNNRVLISTIIAMISDTIGHAFLCTGRARKGKRTIIICGEVFENRNTNNHSDWDDTREIVAGKSFVMFISSTQHLSSGIFIRLCVIWRHYKTSCSSCYNHVWSILHKCQHHTNNTNYAGNNVISQIFYGTITPFPCITRAIDYNLRFKIPTCHLYMCAITIVSLSYSR